MGNNRVLILKNINLKISKEYIRFRFFRFLNDSGSSENIIKNPFSITVNKFTGRVILEGNVLDLGSEKQTIKVYYPIRDNNVNNNSSLKYELKDKII